MTTLAVALTFLVSAALSPAHAADLPGVSLPLPTGRAGKVMQPGGGDGATYLANPKASLPAIRAEKGEHLSGVCTGKDGVQRKPDQAGYDDCMREYQSDGRRTPNDSTLPTSVINFSR